MIEYKPGVKHYFFFNSNIETAQSNPKIKLLNWFELGSENQAACKGLCFGIGSGPLVCRPLFKVETSTHISTLNFSRSEYSAKWQKLQELYDRSLRFYFQSICSKHSKTSKKKNNVHSDFWERLFMKYFPFNYVVCQSALLQNKSKQKKIHISTLTLLKWWAINATWFYAIQ